MKSNKIKDEAAYLKDRLRDMKAEMEQIAAACEDRIEGIKIDLLDAAGWNGRSDGVSVYQAIEYARAKRRDLIARAELLAQENHMLSSMLDKK